MNFTTALKLTLPALAMASASGATTRGNTGAVQSYNGLVDLQNTDSLMKGPVYSLSPLNNALFRTDASRHLMTGDPDIDVCIKFPLAKGCTLQNTPAQPEITVKDTTKASTTPAPKDPTTSSSPGPTSSSSKAVTTSSSQGPTSSSSKAEITSSSQGPTSSSSKAEITSSSQGPTTSSSQAPVDTPTPTTQAQTSADTTKATTFSSFATDYLTTFATIFPSTPTTNYSNYSSTEYMGIKTTTQPQGTNASSTPTFSTSASQTLNTNTSSDMIENITSINDTALINNINPIAAASLAADERASSSSMSAEEIGAIAGGTVGGTGLFAVVAVVVGKYLAKNKSIGIQM